MDLLADLNEPQRQAVLHIDGPLLVLAGAGSGKTRVITRRVAHLIAQGVRPWEVLAITFTNKAAGEMQQRIAALDTPPGAMICTFHSLCARLLRQYADLAGLDNNYSIYDRDDQLRITKQAMERADVPSGRFSPAPVHAAISNAKNNLQLPEAYTAQAGDYFTRIVAEAYREYQKLLYDNNALDFDDLLLRMAMLMRDRPEVRQALGDRYRYVLIDEYQDTNHAQYLIAHGIALDHENICATGDPDQSIYAWRGADVRNILEFEADYPNATVVRLEENYRSTAPILKAASTLISHNRNRKPKDLWTRREGGADVTVILCDNERAEAQRVAACVDRYVADGGRYDDVAVFYRVNALSRVVEEHLFRRGTPYRVARGTEFYGRKEVKDIIAYLRLLANAADDLSCQRIINTPTRGIGNTTVGRLANYAETHGLSLLEACCQAEQTELNKGAAKKVRDFAVLIDALADGAAERPIRETIEAIVEKTEMEEYLRRQSEEGKDAYANVAELISAAAEFDETMDQIEPAENDDTPPPSRLAGYLQQISLVSDADHFEGGDGAVTLMTLHAAKGLEFPMVFVIGCEQGLLPFERGDGPGRDPADNQADLEEERRLAFVGMTRAKDRLFMTCARRRIVRGRTTPMARSPFLDEIGSDSVTVEDVTTPLRDFSLRKRQFGRAAIGGFYADAEEREVIEAMQESVPLPPEYEYLRKGSRVRHPKFGPGTLVGVRGDWPNTRADIHFDTCGPKTIVLAKTTIEMMD